MSSKEYTIGVLLYIDTAGAGTWKSLLFLSTKNSLPTVSVGGYHLWQSQDDNCTAPINLTDKKVVQIRRCEWEIFHIQLM